MTNTRSSERIPSEAELVVAAKTCREAFGRLFDLFYPVIFGYCLRRLVVRANAEDVTSEVFMRVAVGLSEFPGTSLQDFRRWLFCIATNEINAFLRKSARRKELLEQAVTWGSIHVPEELSLPRERVEWQEIYAGLEMLGEQEQEIISLRFFSNQNSEEIGQILGIKSGTVRVIMSRALSKLREHLRSPGAPLAKSKPHGGEMA